MNFSAYRVKNRSSRKTQRASNRIGIALAAIVAPAAATAAVPADFNGDLRSDIVWRNSVGGNVNVWLTDSTGLSKLSGGSVGAAQLEWGIQGVGDFNGDGRADILWRNGNSGSVNVWLIDPTGLGKLSSGSVGSASNDWSVQGVGDFNGDGRADILWRNANSGSVNVWLIDPTGLGRLSSGSVGSASNDWNVQGVGDFNGDGRADILWRNANSGSVNVWLIDPTGLGRLSSGSVGSASNDWSVQGVGDFNGDGRADILWRNRIGGNTNVWLIDSTGLAKQSGGSAGTAGLEWSVQGVGDFNGDGRADILWRNGNSGAVNVWLIDSTGLAKQSGGSIGGASAEWQLAPASTYRCADGLVCDIVTATNGVRANGSFGPGNPAPSPALAPLTWSVGAATVARDYAARCLTTHNPNRGPYGENMYMSAGFMPTGQNVVNDSWGAEAADYTYSTNSCAAGKACGHYTQLVWRNTTAVGCAIQRCTVNTPFTDSNGQPFDGGRWNLVVCNYAPPGNWNGQLPY